MTSLIYLAPVLGIVALLFAFVLAGKVNAMDEGTDRMKEIAGSIREGANAFLSAEYKILVIFAAVLFVAIGFGVNWPTAICFVFGAIFSTLAGFFGMKVATNANVRTANAARTSGMNKALSIAFSGGAVMGMCVVGLGLLGVGAIYAFTGNADILFGFSLGASSIALFGRVGGGIYTKAADVGADLVGKVEAGIPEDDPRNPAVIADNVGDNVGDVAGMGADLFESYVGSIISAITLGLIYYSAEGAVFPLLLSGAGIISAIIGTFFVKGDEKSNPHKALKTGSYTAAVLVAICSVALSMKLFGDFKAAIAVIAGLVVGQIIGVVT
ncbi:MAG: sodium/proton-translocating pyrophosphatase, partial [Anaerotignum sp.]|nr:sodium/proton-translocating pyrophosphatase [Anaerotignum sp.]